ncbi:hypothetical protein KL951_000546 [Ogataea haglerorum]|nr:hypothetical protein KL951_000546 [Ogataea haglerorum]
MGSNSETIEVARGYTKWLDYVVINFGFQIVIYDMNMKPVKRFLIPDINLYHMVTIERYLLVIIDNSRDFLAIMLTWDKEHLEIAYCGPNIKKQNSCFQDGEKSLIAGNLTGWMIAHGQATLYRIYLNTRGVIFQPFTDDGILQSGQAFCSDLQGNVLVMCAVHHRTLCLPWIHRKVVNEEVIFCSNGFDSRFYRFSNRDSQLFGLARTHDGNIRKIIPIGKNHLLLVSTRIRVVLRSRVCNRYDLLGCDEGLEIYRSNGTIPDVLCIRDGHAIICDQEKGLSVLRYRVGKLDFKYKLNFVGEYVKARQMLKLSNYRYIAISSSNVFLFKFTKRWRLEVQRILRGHLFVPFTNLLTESKAMGICSKNCTSELVEVFQDDTTRMTSMKMRSKLKVEQTKIPVLGSFCEIYPIDDYHLYARCLDGHLYELILKGDTVKIEKSLLKTKETENVIAVTATVLVTTKCAVQVDTNDIFSTFKDTALSYESTSSYGVVLTSSMIYIFVLHPNPHVLHKVACNAAHVSMYESDNKDLSIIYDVHGVLHHLKINRANMVHMRSGTGQVDTQALMLLNNNLFASLTSWGTLHFKWLSTFDDVSMIRLPKTCSQVWRTSDSSFAAFSPLETYIFLMTADTVEPYYIQNSRDTLHLQVIGNSLYHLRRSELVISKIISNSFSENTYHHLGPMHNIQIITIEQSPYLIYNDYDNVHLYDLNVKDSLVSLRMPNIQHIYSYKGLRFGDNSVDDRCLILLVAKVNEQFDTSKCTLELVALKVSHDPSFKELFSMKPEHSNWSCLDWFRLKKTLEARSDHQLQIQTIPGSWVVSWNGRGCGFALSV